MRARRLHPAWRLHAAWMAAAAAIASALPASALPAAVQATTSFDSPVTTAPEEVGLSSDVLSRIGPTMRGWIDDGRTAGIVTLVARRGEVVHWEADGWRVLGEDRLERDDIFRIYSMTKPVTTVAVMMLVEEGRIGLDDPVADYIPSFADVRVYGEGGDLRPPARAVRIRDLLSHTSGLTYGAFGDTPVDSMYRAAGIGVRGGGTDLEGMVARIASMPLLSDPGSRWTYSVSTDVLGRVVEVASGATLDRFFRERIFEPLGMHDTGFHVPPEKRDRFVAVYGPTEDGLRMVDSPVDGPFTRPPDWFSGGGGLTSTASDYFRFAQMLLNEGELEGTRLLESETVRTMRRNHLPDALMPIGLGGPDQGFGLGFAVSVGEDAGTFWWAGVANTYFWIDPAEELIAFAWTQFSPFGAAAVDRALRPIVYEAIVDGGDRGRARPEAVRRRPVQADQAVPDVGWPRHGLDAAETRYSPLDRITTENVADLREVWSWEIPKRGARIETTPLIVDGVMYATGALSFVFALDARTGEERWRWDPAIPTRANGGPPACCGRVNRGVAYHDGTVFVGLLDGRLVALDADDGSVVWSVRTTPPGTDHSITGAPRVAGDLVVIGNGGAEYGVRGYVTAYDVESGRERWRTYTVPGDPALGFESDAMEAAAATWTGAWWTAGGGGTVWDAMVYDERAGLLYVGTGNGSPWSRDHRSPGGGDNLYLSSIMALNAEDGALVWHYQTTPGDDWDYTATQPLMLLDLEIEGRERSVIVQAPKNGFFYVLDRYSGELLSAEAFADDLTWATGVDPETGRPVETPEARYGMTGRGVYLSPGPRGAHNWHTMSWNQATGLVYLPAQNTVSYYARTAEFEYEPGSWNTGTGSVGEDDVEEPELVGPRNLLLAWDPAENREVWRIPKEEGHGGTLSTAGNLVFWTTGSDLVALDARSGDELWSVEVGRGGSSPVTFSLDGRQYVSVAAGLGGAGGPPRVTTFVLGSLEQRPSDPPLQLSKGYPPDRNRSP